MRAIGSGLLLTALLAAQPAFALDATEAMRAFGLVGSWSVDCSTDMSRPCEDLNRCYPRLTFTLPLQDRPTQEVVSPTSAQGMVYRSAMEIGSAAQISADKIQITATATKPIADATGGAPQAPGQTWETVYQKSGTNLRVWSAMEVGGTKVAVRDGYRVDPASGQPSDQATPMLSKCD
jgi:hypothetical protein